MLGESERMTDTALCLEGQLRGCGFVEFEGGQPMRVEGQWETVGTTEGLLHFYRYL